MFWECTWKRRETQALGLGMPCRFFLAAFHPRRAALTAVMPRSFPVPGHIPVRCHVGLGPCLLPERAVMRH